MAARWWLDRHERLFPTFIGDRIVGDVRASQSQKEQAQGMQSMQSGQVETPQPLFYLQTLKIIHPPHAATVLAL